MSDASRHRSPAVSECSTATGAGLRSLQAVPTARYPSSVSSSAFSVFSQIGRHLSALLQALGRGGSRKRRRKRRVATVRARRPNAPNWVFSCKGCERGITEHDVLHDNAVRALGGTWHRKHLVCWKCSAPVGEERRPFLGGGSDGTRVLCLDCHMESANGNCAACDKPLFEECLEVDGKRVHKSCFICERCRAPFEDKKYVMLNDKPYDQDCFFFKKFEQCFLAPAAPMLFDVPTASPPAHASASDSSSGPPTTSMLEDTPTVKRKPELIALCDIGKSVENKAKSPTQKEEAAHAVGTGTVIELKNPDKIDSQEKLSPSDSSPVREKLEDFANGAEELLARKLACEVPISPPVKKDIGKSLAESPKVSDKIAAELEKKAESPKVADAPKPTSVAPIESKPETKPPPAPIAAESIPEAPKPVEKEKPKDPLSTVDAPLTFADLPKPESSVPKEGEKTTANKKYDVCPSEPTPESDSLREPVKPEAAVVPNETIIQIKVTDSPTTPISPETTKVAVEETKKAEATNSETPNKAAESEGNKKATTDDIATAKERSAEPSVPPTQSEKAPRDVPKVTETVNEQKPSTDVATASGKSTETTGSPTQPKATGGDPKPSADVATASDRSAEPKDVPKAVETPNDPKPSADVATASDRSAEVAKPPTTAADEQKPSADVATASDRSAEPAVPPTQSEKAPKDVPKVTETPNDSKPSADVSTASGKSAESVVPVSQSLNGKTTEEQKPSADVATASDRSAETVAPPKTAGDEQKPSADVATASDRSAESAVAPKEPVKEEQKLSADVSTASDRSAEVVKPPTTAADEQKPSTDVATASDRSAETIAPPKTGADEQKPSADVSTASDRSAESTVPPLKSSAIPDDQKPSADVATARDRSAETTEPPKGPVKSVPDIDS